MGKNITECLRQFYYVNFSRYVIITFILYSNKKDTPDFHGTVSFGPIKMYQQKINHNVYQTSDTLFDFIFLSGRVIEPKVKTAHSTIMSKLIIKTRRILR